MSEGATPTPEPSQAPYRYKGGGWCGCARCRCRGLLGPVILIAVGVIFMMGQFTRWDWSDLWPLILIVIGAMKLLESTASTQGHRG